MKPREPRRKVLVRARVCLDGTWSDVCIRNISSRGLLLERPAPPRRGTYIDIRRGRHVITARVAWAEGSYFGVHTREKLNVDAIIAEPDLSALDFKATTAARPEFERRAAPRPTAQALARRADNARLLGRIGEFACVTTAGLTLAVILFSTVAQTLARPISVTTTHLKGVAGP